MSVTTTDAALKQTAVFENKSSQQRSIPSQNYSSSTAYNYQRGGSFSKGQVHKSKTNPKDAKSSFQIKGCGKNMSRVEVGTGLPKSPVNLRFASALRRSRYGRKAWKKMMETLGQRKGKANSKCRGLSLHFQDFRALRAVIQLAIRAAKATIGITIKKKEKKERSDRRQMSHKAIHDAQRIEEHPETLASVSQWQRSNASRRIKT